MVQNHLMQILCLVAMEPMASFDADEIRNRKVDVLHAIRPIPRELVGQYVVRGQYAEGWIEGQKVAGYRDEDGVGRQSATETFVALKLRRWTSSRTPLDSRSSQHGNSSRSSKRTWDTRRPAKSGMRAKSPRAMAATA